MSEKLVKMEIGVPESWKGFLTDIARCYDKEPAAYWGKEFIDMIKGFMDSEKNAQVYYLQDELMKKYRLVKE